MFCRSRQLSHARKVQVPTHRLMRTVLGFVRDSLRANVREDEADAADGESCEDSGGGVAVAMGERPPLLTLGDGVVLEVARGVFTRVMALQPLIHVLLHSISS